MPPDHTVYFRLRTMLDVWVVHHKIDEDDKCSIGLRVYASHHAPTPIKKTNRLDGG